MSSVAEQRLDLALRAAGLGTWTWDMAAETTTWDVRLEELHGLPPGGFGGRFDDWVAALHPEDRAQCLERVQRALAHPGPYVLLHRTVWPDGSIHWIECRGRVTVDDEGRPSGTIGVALDVTDRERRKQAVAAELAEQRDVVATLQRTLLPVQLPSVPDVRLVTRYGPARSSAVGGDWYASVPLPDGRLGLAIGDVAGHGPGAVADMAGARFSLRALALEHTDPAEVLNRLNQAVELFEGGVLITGLYGIVDVASGRWSFSSAGHCPAVVRDAGGTAALVTTRGQPPLGLGACYVGQERRLEAGATLILYTDGLVERRDEPITDGFERLVAAVGRGPADPEALADHLLAELLDEGSNDDDVALLIAAVA